MVALRRIAGRRLRVLHQPLLVDFQMRMPVAVERSGHGLQYPHGSRKTLPILRARLEGTSSGDDRDHRPAASRFAKSSLGLAGSPRRHFGPVSTGRRRRRARSGLVGRVLEPLELADLGSFRPYWNFLWDSNRPTYYSSPSSSGLPSKFSIAAEADAAAGYPFAPTNLFQVNFV